MSLNRNSKLLDSSFAFFIIGDALFLAGIFCNWDIILECFAVICWIISIFIMRIIKND